MVAKKHWAYEAACIALSPAFLSVAMLHMCTADGVARFAFGVAYLCGIAVTFVVTWLDAKQYEQASLVWNGKDYHGVLVLRDKIE
jgi:hypothetical protein